MRRSRTSSGTAPGIPKRSSRAARRPRGDSKRRSTRPPFTGTPPRDSPTASSWGSAASSGSARRSCTCAGRSGLRELTSVRWIMDGKDRSRVTKCGGGKYMKIGIIGMGKMGDAVVRGLQRKHPEATSRSRARRVPRKLGDVRIQAPRHPGPHRQREARRRRATSSCFA